MKAAQPSNRLCFGNFEVDLRVGELRKQGVKLRLPEQSFQILAMLLERPGELVTREEIQKRLWPNDTVVEFENSISAAIRRLRLALGDSADDPRFVETLPRRGYRFVANVRELGGEDVEVLVKERTKSQVVIRETEEISCPEVAQGSVGTAQRAPGTKRRLILMALMSVPSSVRYLVNYLSHHKRTAISLLGAIIVAVAWFSSAGRAPAITEKDTLLLADFVNTTGDAVFDGTLKQALAVQLEQTPFLSLFPEERVRETLRYMGRSPDERVSKEVAREICQRQGIKAMIVGSIASLGRNYALTLEATNASTGEVMARRQVEAEGKEQVLGALGRATTELRKKLGESLASIQKFDAPIMQATTSSLEALRAYAMGCEVEYRQGKLLEAIPFYKRAIELDNNFALAYFHLSGMYGNTLQSGSMESAEKAFALKDRVSERERLEISAYYYRNITGEFDRALAVTELLTRTYPRHADAHYLLGNWYRDTGQYEKALEPYREASRLDPGWPLTYRNLALALIRLDRFDEAREVIERALARKLDDTGYYIGYHTQLYQIAFVRGDRAAMKQQLDWAGGKREEYELLDLQAQAAAYAGQRRRARELSERAAKLAEARNLKAPVAGISVKNALQSAIFDFCLPAKEDTSRALALVHSWREGGAGLPVRPKVALALALCDDLSQAQSLANDIALKYSQATLSQALWLPMIRAAVELRRGNADQAIQLLQPTSQFEPVGQFWPTYLRGQAYLRLNMAPEAAAEFQKILDHRGWDPVSLLYPLAHLGLARAWALKGDAAQSRTGYQDFFALWKDADPDLPILVQAQREYKKLS